MATAVERIWKLAEARLTQKKFSEYASMGRLDVYLAGVDAALIALREGSTPADIAASADELDKLAAPWPASSGAVPAKAPQLKIPPLVSSRH